MAYGVLYKKNNIIDDIAQKYKKNWNQILIQYAHQKKFDVITMATEKAYIEDNFNIHFELDEADMKIIDSLNENFSLYKRYL
jgi:diketogulonate reductase-like aldo/keto reductase